ncbi:MAG TPA: hypothetical protein VGO59_01525 [Verrucomicrobiae bacterium]|jgi:Tfp pilus assembly protein FimV
MSRIHVHIDKLVLPAAAASSQTALVAGMKAELARALANPAARAAWARSHRTPVLRLGRMPLKPGLAGGKQFGASLGRSIGKGLKP